MPATSRFFLLIAFAISSLSSLSAGSLSGLVGSWSFDATRSTDLSPFRSCQLTLSQDGSKFTIARHMDGGRRDHNETMTLDLSQATTEVPQTWWVDNRHLGAYSPKDGTQKISAKTLDNGQVLRLEIEFTLETQQGTRAVNTIRQFQLSPDGQRLTVTDLRSTRPLPVVHVFNRVTN